MKWTTLISLLFCAANFVTAVAILGVCSYNMTVATSRDQHFPVEVMNGWRDYLSQLIPAMAYVIVCSVFGCWCVTRKRKPCTAFLVLSLHVTALLLCSVYCELISELNDAPPTSGKDMKNQTKQIFAHYQSSHQWNSKWVPEWLTNVQSMSDSCCGIMGFEDYKEFWREHSQEVPVSCCKKPDKCITNLEHIEWPQIPGDYIKNDEGCFLLVNDMVQKKIFETVQMLFGIIILLVISIIVFSIQYIVEYCTRRRMMLENFKNNENIENSNGILSVGETWDRMGFGKKNTDKNNNNTNNDKNGSKSVSGSKSRKSSSKKGVRFDNQLYEEIDQGPATTPGSYTDIYLKHLQNMQTSSELIIPPSSSTDNSSTVPKNTKNNTNSKLNPNSKVQNIKDINNIDDENIGDNLVDENQATVRKSNSKNYKNIIVRGKRK